MINIKDLYTVLSAMVPLYAAMILAYGSVRWWKIFTPVQCSGINRFVAVFAVPLLSFHFISINNPYKMDGLFILADTVSKLVILFVLALWAKFSRSGSLDWMITLFALATLPNTLVMGIPLLKAMYGDFYGGVMVQLVVLQCIIWYTIMLFLFEYRAARLLVMEQFPETAASIISFKVESDVMSLDGREPLQTEADVGEDGKIRVIVRRSTSSSTRSRGFPYTSAMSPSRPSFVAGGFTSMPSSTRPSNLTGAEIYSVYSSRNNTPRDFHYGHGTTDLHSFVSARGGFVSPRQSFNASDHVYSVQSSRGPTPRPSNFNDDNYINREATFNANPAQFLYTKGLNSPRVVYNPAPAHTSYIAPPTGNISKQHSPRASHISKKISEPGQSPVVDDDGKELHMFVWSSTGSPVSEAGALTDPAPNESSGNGIHDLKQVKVRSFSVNDQTENVGMAEPLNPNLLNSSCSAKDFSFGSKSKLPGDVGEMSSPLDKHDPSSPKQLEADQRPKEMPPAQVMIKLILQMVGRKLLRNPNTYSSVIGLAWSLIAFRWNINMPTIILNSISILSDAGLGMAMFSLGLFMALQPRLIACGASLATFAMAVRFLTGPAVMAASSIAVGLRGVELHAAIVQAALPQGIVPFVFAREYDLHPDILSTAVIFGMLVALPTTLLYYVLLGL